MYISQKNFELLYNPRIAVPDFQVYIDRWKKKSIVFKKKQVNSSLIDIKYGNNTKETLDLFFSSKRKANGLVIFIHGGYWRSLDKSQHSFVAEPFCELGYNTAIVNYSLCPEVKVEDIVLQLVNSCIFLYKNSEDLNLSLKDITVLGHSAGGHLAAMLMCCKWKECDPKLPENLIKKGFSISGLYDLRILTKYKLLNKDINLNNESSKRLSPSLMQPNISSSFGITVGGQEGGGFKHQHSILYSKWKKFIVCEIPAPKENHFSILESLVDKKTTLYKNFMNDFFKKND